MEKITTLYSNTLNETFMKELNVQINVEENVYDLPLGSLFQMAARKNPKRNFLFVSKLLGKHISVPPQIPLLSGLLLSDLYLQRFEGNSPYDAQVIVRALMNHQHISSAMNELQKAKPSLQKKTLFLGFAETATGLGHAMFNGCGENAEFITTTRDRILDFQPTFEFEEEHSHATGHLCYSMDPAFFEKFERIVLVDDEITTGKTSLNLIEALNAQYPGKEYVVASFLDWRNKEEVEKYQQAEQNWGIKIQTLSLVKGEISYLTTPLTFPETPVVHIENPMIDVKTISFPVNPEGVHSWNTVNSIGETKEQCYYQLTGRFGMDASQNEQLDEEAEKCAAFLEQELGDKKTLCLGSGELIFIPALIASKWKKPVLYHSTTRSPVYSMNREDYPIQHAIPFTNPEDAGVANYLYNVVPGKYEQIIWFLERDISNEHKEFLSKQLRLSGIQSLLFVTLS